ncbi:3-oxoadipate CoA-transferase, partial [Pollutimonas nitritireducens]
GIGRPMLVSNHLPAGKDIILHSENGVLGMGAVATGPEADPDYVNAGKQSITLRNGAALFHHADSFSMIRGGHIDICILGAFQVSEQGDLANWRTMDETAIPAVGGAMDLAVGAKQVFIMMEHLTKDGESKLVRSCSYPLTAARVVTRVYTDLATLEVTEKGFKVVDRVVGLSHEELESISKLIIQEE